MTQPHPSSDEGMTTMTDQSSIRHTESQHIDTFRGVDSSGRATPTRLTPPFDTATISHNLAPNGQSLRGTSRNYVAPMATAQAVLDAIEDRKPNLPDTYKHNLLFFCQGHHLATHGIAMFGEPLHATPAGAIVTVTAGTDDKVSKKELGMVGWIMHRYAAMFPVDLRSLVTVSTAWQQGRSSTDRTIDQAWLTEWFSRPDELSPEGRIAVADIAEIFGAARN